MPNHRALDSNTDAPPRAPAPGVTRPAAAPAPVQDDPQALWRRSQAGVAPLKHKK